MKFNLKKIGAICKESRKRNEKTQYDVAEAVGVTQQCVSMFENGYNSSFKLLAYYLTVFVEDSEEEMIKNIMKDGVYSGEDNEKTNSRYGSTKTTKTTIEDVKNNYGTNSRYGCTKTQKTTGETG